MRTVGQPSRPSSKGPYEFEWQRPTRVALVVEGECRSRRPARFVFGTGVLAPEAPGPLPHGPWISASHDDEETSPLREHESLDDFLASDLTDEDILQLVSKHGFLGRFLCDVLIDPNTVDSENQRLFIPPMIQARSWRRPSKVLSGNVDQRRMAKAEPIESWRHELVRIQALQSVWSAIQTFPTKGSPKAIENSVQALTLESFVGEAVTWESSYGRWQRSRYSYMPHRLGLPAHLEDFQAPLTFGSSRAVTWAIQSGRMKPGERGFPTSDIRDYPRLEALKLVAEFAVIEQLNLALCEGSNFALYPEHLSTLRLAPADLLGWLYLRLAEAFRGGIPAWKKCKHEPCPRYFRWRSNKKYCSYRCRDNARYRREHPEVDT